MEIAQPQKELFLNIANFTGFDYSVPIFPRSVETLVTSKRCFWFISEDRQSPHQYMYKLNLAGK